jgi:hypothetical protein
VAHAILGGILAALISGVGISGGSVSPPSIRDSASAVLVLLGPFAASLLGTAVGIYVGYRIAKGRMAVVKSAVV